MSVFVKQTATPCAFTSSESWVILSPIEQSIKRKIETIGTPLKDWDVNIYRGILTGCNEAFIIDENKRQEILTWCADVEERKRTEQIIRPILRGRDVKRYAYNWAGLYLLWIPWHFPLHEDESIIGASEKAESEFSKQFPAVYKHLFYYKDVLSKRNQSETGIRYEWYALQRWGANYWDEFCKPKIVWMDLSDVPTFAYDDNTQFANNTVYFLSGGENLLFLLGYLNSKIATYLFSQIGSTSGVGTTRWQAFTMERLFVPHTTSEKQSRITELVDRLLMAKNVNPSTDTSSIEQEIDRLVYRLYGLTTEEIAVVEDKLSCEPPK